MCLFIQNFSSTEFNSFPSAQQCLCGLGAKMRPFAFFYKTKNAGYLEEGVPLKQAGKELPERRERNQWPGSQKGCERKAQHQCSVEVKKGNSYSGYWVLPPSVEM